MDFNSIHNDYEQGHPIFRCKKLARMPILKISDIILFE